MFKDWSHRHQIIQQRYKNVVKITWQLL